MIAPKDIERALSGVNDQASFLHLLSRTLRWPIEGASIEDVSYTWTTTDLRAADLEARVVDSRIFQIANLDKNQPWGVFVIEFKHPDAFLAERGMTGVLRQVLRGLVPSKRKDASQPSWKREHLLFICTHQYKHFRVAYFKAPPEGTKTAPLAAFGWGPDIPARTACEFNLPALHWPDNPQDARGWVSHWAAAFDVDKVTKRFYTDYAARFETLKRSINGVTGEEQKMFTQTLLNRLMFLRFIERKGWLTPPGGEQSKDYLRLLFQAGGYLGNSFYAGRLTKLFFEALAIEGEQQSEAIGKVPFLNGGLFEASDLDKKVADIPDAAFAPILGPDGLFYRYNFTVQESTPLDIEVAVDPEMLGKVFEELVTGRHESGSYYTPRPVVSFMCREALKGYLTDTAKLAPDAVAAFVDKHDVTGLKLQDAKRIAEALDTVRAVDPACGSGAYLLGLLHEIVDLYRLLYSDKLKSDARELHRIKLDIIQNSLYGVDIDPFATNIAMLRLWLSLTVDSDEPAALPNLDFKIETGDSVSGPNPQKMPEVFERLKLDEKALQLAIIKGRYMRARGDEKQTLRRLIVTEQREIAFELQSLSPGCVDWRVQFCEVFFSDRGGFDIVLANPPYIRHELIKHLKPALKNVYGNLYSGTADLYVFFYLRALQLLAPGGMLVFISSNKWFRAGYGEKLRAHLAKTTTVQTILDFHDLPVFESAIAYPMIFTAAKRPATDTHTATLAEPPNLDPPYPDVAAVVARYGHRLSKGALGARGNWHLSHSSLFDRMNQMRGAGPSLAELVGERIFAGIKTGLNDAFLIDAEIRAQLISEHPPSAEVIKPFLKGKDLDRWTSVQGQRFIIYMPHGIQLNRFPAIKKHLLPHRDALSARALDQEWYELQQPQFAFTETFSRTKIIYPNVSYGARFTLDTGSYLDMTAFCIDSDDPYLLGVLNSGSISWFFSQLGIERRGGYQEFKTQYVRQLPIPTASAADRSAIGALAQKCLDARGIGCEAWEREIDERVAALYVSYHLKSRHR